MFLKRLASFFFLRKSLPFLKSILICTYIPKVSSRISYSQSSAIVRETRKQDKLLVAIGTVSLFWILFFLQVTVLFRLVWLKCPCLLFSKLKAITHTFFSLYTRIFAGPSSVLSTSSFKHPAPGGDHNISLTTIYLLAFLTGLYFDNL